MSSPTAAGAPIFTERHYSAIAAAFAASRPIILQHMGRYTDESIAWERALGATVDTFRTDNPTFDANRFIDAAFGTAKAKG